MTSPNKKSKGFNETIKDGDYIIMSNMGFVKEVFDQGYMGVTSCVKKFEVKPETLEKLNMHTDVKKRNQAIATFQDDIFDSLKIPDDNITDIFSPFLIKQRQVKEEEYVDEDLWTYPQNFHASCVFEIQIASISQNQSSKNQPVRYGMNIRLKHRSSQRYLTASNVPSSDGSKSFMVDLVKKPTNRSIFVIDPKFQMRSEGEVVFAADLCKLKSQQSQLYLCYRMKDLDSQKPLVMKNKEFAWKITPFNKGSEARTIKQDKKAIKAGDYLKLLHREKEGYLNVRYKDFAEKYDSQELSLPEMLFDKYLPETPPHEQLHAHVKLSNCIKKSKTKTSCTNIFKLELVDQADGSRIAWEQPVRIKHMLSNMYLAIVEINQNVWEAQLVDTHLGSGNLFQMIPMASAQTKEYATASSFCRIMHMDSGLFLGAMNQKGNLNMENLTKHSLIKAHFKAGNQKSLFDNELEEEGIENVSDEDGSEHGGSTGGGTDNQSIAGKTSKSEGGGKDQDNNQLKDIYKKKKNKELKIALNEIETEDDFFKLETVPDDEISLMEHIRALALLLKNFIDACREYDVKKPPAGACHSLQIALVGLVIELTAMKRSSFAISYKELEQYSQFAKAKVKQQKFIIEQNVVEMLHRIIKIFWDNIFKKIYGPDKETTFSKMQKLENELEPAEKVCKLAHLALKLTVQNNKKAVQSVIEVDFLGLMLQQIQTPWKMCYNELILNPFIRDAASDINLQVLQRTGIKALVDQLYKAIQKGKFVRNILELLGTVCTPGGKTDRKIQDLVFEMIVGTDDVPEVYTQLDKNARVPIGEAGNSVFLHQVSRRKDGRFQVIVNAENLRRPTYYMPDFKNKLLNCKVYDRERNRGKTEIFTIEEILADPDTVPDRRKFKLKQNYFLGQIRLFTILCQDYNKEAQIVIQQLIPPEFILEVLKSNILLGYKKVFVELLTALYLNYYNMEVPPNTLMPDILLWNDRVEKKSKHNRVVEEIEKVFTLQAFKKKKKAHRENTLEGDEDLQEALNEFYKPQTTEKFKKQETKNKQNLDDVADESPHRLPTLGLRGDQREGTDAHEGQDEQDRFISEIAVPEDGALIPQATVSPAGMPKQRQHPLDASQEIANYIKESEERNMEEQKEEFKGFQDQEEDQNEDNEERQEKIYSVKRSVKDLVQVYKNRLALHHFITDILREEDFHWNTRADANQRSDSKQDFFLSFFISFLKMVEILMKRGFFEEGYDDLLEEAIKKYCPEELIGLVPRGVPHLDQPLPDYIEKQKVKLSFEEQQKLQTSFYLHLKFNLMEKMRTTRPQYFKQADKNLASEFTLLGAPAKREKHTFKKSLEHRLDCYDSESLLISRIMNLVSSIIYLIYDHYQSKTLAKLWKVYRKIAHQWVDQRRKENDAEHLKTKKIDFNTDIMSKSLNFGRRLDASQADVSDNEESMIHKSLTGQQNTEENQKKKEEKEEEDQDQDGDGDGDDDDENENEDENQDDEEGADDKSEKSQISEKEEDDLFQQNSRVKLIEFKKLKASHLESAKKPIEKFIHKYLGGHYDYFALGKQKKLQADDLVQLMTDLLYYDDDQLTTQTMDLIFRHFNQFHTLIAQLDKSLLLFDQEEDETYVHIRQLKHKFALISDSATFTDDVQTLMDLSYIFLSPKTETEDPSLIELCYTTFWAFKCQYCNRWWRDRKRQNAKEKAQEAKDKSKALADACEASHKVPHGAGLDRQESNARSTMIIKAKDYKVTKRDIVAKNQYLLDKLKLHKDVMRFLTNMTYNLSSEQRIKLEASQQKMGIVQKCYKFLLGFCQDNDKNKVALCKKEYFKVFIQHMTFSWLKKLVINLMIELLDDNDTANQLIKPKHVKAICQGLFEDDEKFKLKMIILLKNLAENNLGVKKDRQQLVIGAIRKIQFKIEEQQESGKRTESMNNEKWLAIYKCENSKEFYDVLENFREKGGMVSQTCEELSIPIPESVRLHLEFVDLIGVCAKGKNIAAELFGAKLLPLESICKIILTPYAIPLKFQGAYLRAIHCIYFSTEKSLKSGLKTVSNSAADSLLTICLENMEGFIKMLENFTYQMRRVSQLYDQKVAMIESDLNPDDEKAKSIHILNLSNKRLIEDNPLQSTQRENHDINNPVDQKYDFDDLMGWNNTYVFEIMMPFIQELVDNHLESMISHLNDYYEVIDQKIKPGNRMSVNQDKILASMNVLKIQKNVSINAEQKNDSDPDDEEEEESDNERPQSQFGRISQTAQSVSRSRMGGVQDDGRMDTSNSHLQFQAQNKAELEEIERKKKSFQQVFKLVLSWTGAALKLSSYDFIVSRLNRREALIDFLSAVANRKKVAGTTLLDEVNLNQINQVIEDLKKKSSTLVSEDLEHQNQQSLENFIKKQCIPMMNRTTKKVLQKKALKNSEEGQIQLKLLEKELGQDVYPEFLGFVGFFRAKLLRYCLYKAQETNMSKEKLSNFLPRITYKGKKINQQIEPAQAASDITYKYRGETQHLKLHEDFDHYTEFESKLFKNIFKILKNLEVRALQATDIGFVKLFQSILLLQGATIMVKIQVGGAYQRFNFETEDKTEKPKNLENIQKRLEECGSLELVSNMISISYEDYEKDRSTYFSQILSASINLGSTLLSYGNNEIQNKIIKDYKKALKVTSIGQKFLLGIKKLLRKGFERIIVEVTKEKRKQTQNMLLSLLLFLQNLCEDGNKENKAFLRFQNLTFSEVDIVSEIAHFGEKMLQSFMQNIKYIEAEEQPSLMEILGLHYVSNNERQVQLIDYFASERMPKKIEMKLIIQTYRTLIEFCQGPIRDNQDMIANHSFVFESINFLNYTGSFFMNYQKLNTDKMEGLPFRGDNMEDLFRVITCAVIENSGVQIEVPQAQKDLPDMDDLKKSQVKNISIPKSVKKLGGKLLRKYELCTELEAKEKKKYDSLLLSVENNILILLQSLIEGRMLAGEDQLNENGSDPIASTILEKLDIDLYLNNLDNYYNNAKYLPLSVEENRFLYYALLTHLLEIENGKSELGVQIFKLFKKWKENKNDIKEQMGRIEILNENGQLELLYFKIPKEIMLHWKAPLIEKVREEILTQIKLENPEEKVRSFLDLSEKLVLAVYHQANIAKIKDYVPMIGWMLYLFVSNRKFFNILSMVLSLGLNIVMVNVIVGPKKECPQEVQQNLIKFCPTEPYETWNNSVEEGLFVIFAWINAVVFSIILLDHCINNMNLNIMEYMQREKEREQKIKDLGLMSAEQWTYSWTSYIYGFLGVSILDPMFIFLFLITLASYYGIYYHAWLCVCLAIPITENATLRKVIDAAVGHWDQLIFTILLGVVILYWYAIIAFYNWPDGKFYYEGVPVQCDTLYNCFRMMSDYGFAAFPFWEDDTPLPNKAIAWNFSYILIVNLVLTAIISGIIIDSFSDQRQKAEDRRDEQQNICFICSIDREDFERYGIDFNSHIKQDHNMWNYIKKKIQLQNNEKDELSGQDQYLWEQYQQQNISFFPLQKAIQISSSKEKKDIHTLFLRIQKMEENLLEKATKTHDTVLKRISAIEQALGARVNTQATSKALGGLKKF